MNADSTMREWSTRHFEGAVRSPNLSTTDAPRPMRRLRRRAASHASCDDRTRARRDQVLANGLLPAARMTLQRRRCN